MALESLIAGFKALCATLPDRRRGENTVYDMTDICMAAFSVFFMQSPSFLALQTALQRGRGTSNCQTLFGMERIPTDNHIRTMLDPVPPETLFTMFDTTLAARGRRRARLVPAAGRPCADRARRHRVFLLAEAVVRELLGAQARQWKIEHFHAMVSAALVAPGHERALPLEPEFVTPQDGAEKQDCEARATHRWLAAHGPKYALSEADLSGR